MAASSAGNCLRLLARLRPGLMNTGPLKASSRFLTVSESDSSREVPKPISPGARVCVKGQVCSNPQEARTNLLNFLTQSDVQKRASNIDIPLFLPGSILAVTRTDPYSKSGETRFVGICIARHNKGLGSNFILRNVVNGIAVEVRFELYSPMIKKIEVLKLERRRRAKLYYLRGKRPRENTFSETMKPFNTDKVLVHKRRRK